MNKSHARAGFMVGLLLVLALAGCATPGTRSRYLERISPESITNLSAYREGNTIELRYPLGGHSTFAHATWLPAVGNATEYRCQLATLNLAREKRTTRTAVVKPENRLAIRDAKQWKKLCQALFAGLVPDQPGHGVRLLVQTMEIVIYRETDGTLKVATLGGKPTGILLDRTYDDTEFSQAAIKHLEAGAVAIDRGQTQFLFQTGGDPTFVLVDLRERLMVFLSYPADPDTKPVDVPGWFTLRAMNELLIKSFLITAIKNPVTLVSRGLWHLANSGKTILDTVPSVSDAPPPPLTQGPGMDLAKWEKDLDGLVSARRYKGRVQYFIDGSEFFPAFIQAMENARQSIEVMVYIFDQDPFAVQVADILKQRSGQVKVKVLMDDIGSFFAQGASPLVVPPNFQPPGDIASYLESGSHVKVRVTTDPWLATDHRKCIIIDDHQAYIGGMNIGWVYRYEWHDLMVGLTGPIVGRLDKDYRKAWAFAGPGGDFALARADLFDRTNPRKNPIADGIDLRPLRTATANSQIYQAQLEAIRRTKSYIYIETAYLNDDTILRELIRARQRGVDVKVILPAENDIALMQTSNQVMANEMIRHGIGVYMYPGMTHVKAAIYDGWACVGSANMEKMSLRISQELDIAFSDPASVDQLKARLFDPDFNRSRQLTSPITLQWLDPVLKAFANQL